MVWVRVSNVSTGTAKERRVSVPLRAVVDYAEKEIIDLEREREKLLDRVAEIGVLIAKLEPMRYLAQRALEIDANVVVRAALPLARKG